MMKKLVALILAVVMVMAMGSVAFADDYGVNDSGSNEISFVKTIDVYNAENITVYGPGITYTYAIAPVNSSNEGELITDTTITDVSGKTITVRNGITAGVSFKENKNSAIFTENDPVSITSSGHETVSKNVTLTITPSAFPAAGVYRYKITETSDTNAMNAAGITRDTTKYNDTRYLDIYMKNNTAGTAREVMGYVMFVSSSATADISRNPATTTNQIDGKTTGFEEQYDENLNGTSDATDKGLGDKYYTYNYTVTKDIKGDLADQSHPFPFDVETSGAVTYHQFTVETTATTVNNVTVTGITDTSVSGGTTTGVGKIGTKISTGLADDKTITLKGLPANTKVTVTETNDTDEVYKVTVKEATGDLTIVDAANTNKGATQTTAEKAITNYTAYNTPVSAPTAAMTSTTFTNELDDISITGVAMRVAPYILILATGMVLVLISRRWKAEEE